MNDWKPGDRVIVPGIVNRCVGPDGLTQVEFMNGDGGEQCAAVLVPADILRPDVPAVTPEQVREAVQATVSGFHPEPESVADDVVARLFPPALPDDPPVGSVVIDADGIAWQRHDRATLEWRSPTLDRTWEALVPHLRDPRPVYEPTGGAS